MSNRFDEGYPEIKDIKRVGRRREIAAVKILDLPAYSPEIAPRDFHLILHLKKSLADQMFYEDGEVANEVTTWLCE
jgi:hypothetical protein